MKLWKKTVALMLVTLLCALLLVGGSSLYITARRNLNNSAETSAKQMETGAKMLEQFWDQSRYEMMSEVGKRSYREFQFRLCIGSGFALLIEETGEAVENLTGYEVVDTEALGLAGDEKTTEYRIQKLGNRYLMLQKMKMNVPEGCSLLSVQDITEIFRETGQTALWFLGIYVLIFFMAGFFIYQMMKKTVKSMEELQEVAQKQELLLGALTHEMKTPLTSIIGYSEALRQVKLQEEQKYRALEHISSEGRRMEALSSKMLQLLGLHRNNAIQMERQSVQDLFERVLQLETEKVRERGILLCAEGENFDLEMDRDLMESLLLNLVDNAVKASREGGRIVLRSICTEKTRQLQVEDFGSGIPREELKRVTEAFYMVDKSRSRQQGGAGLGLAICDRIAVLHKGKLEIVSEEGRGTCVTVSFPVK